MDVYVLDLDGGPGRA